MEMPSASIYDSEMEYFPWGRLLDRTIEIMADMLPIGGKVLDLMCGPGYLLRKLKAIRPDLELQGIDNNLGYVNYAYGLEPNVTWSLASVTDDLTLGWYDAVVCTGSLHHLVSEEQEKLIKRMAVWLKSEGVCLMADTCTAPYRTELERKYAVLDLNRAYLEEVIIAAAPNHIIEAMVDVLRHDLLKEEYKFSKADFQAMALTAFEEVEIERFWPKEKTNYGDYLIMARGPKWRSYYDLSVGGI